MHHNIPVIQWAEKEVRLEELTPFEGNPRKITEDQFLKLKASLIRLGQFRPLLVTHDLRLAGGHQRVRAMRELGWETCRVSVPQRAITDNEYRQLLLQDNHNNGTWDFDVLANGWDLEEMRTVGIHDVMNMPPFEKLEAEADGDQKPKAHYKCPECQHVFAGKGNKADDVKTW